MSEWVIIGVPTSAGAHHAGQDLAPDALREAGLGERLRAAGVSVTDAGNRPGSVFAADHDAPGARNLGAVVEVAADVANAVADAARSGRLPLVLGGDCTITIGAVAGLRRVHDDLGLVYVDGDADLWLRDDTSSGILDSTGIWHLLGRGAPELSGLGGKAPLLTPDRLAILGSDPRETSDAGRQFLADSGVSFTEGPAFSADPAGTTERALATVTGSSERFLVHFDVDVVDSGDLPLGNFPHYGSGVRLDDVVAGLRVLLRHPSLAGLVLTEVNPTHDPAGAELRRLVDALVTAIGDGPR